MRLVVIKRNITFAMLILFLPVFALAEDVKVVVAEGHTMIEGDITVPQARALARNNARRNALEQAVGVSVHGATVLYNSDLVSDLVVTATKGLIIEEDILEDEPQVKGKQLSYFFKLRAYVKPINIERRGNFKILKAEIFRAERKTGLMLPVFQQNDEIQVKVKINEDSFINIFSVSQDGEISQLFPNNYFNGEVVNADKIFIFPDDTQRGLGIKLRVRTPKKLSKAVESILVIATKERIKFLSDEDIKDPTITDLMKELSELDLSLWAEKTVGYEVRK